MIIPLIIWITIIASQLLTLGIQSVSSENSGGFFSLVDLGNYWRNLLIVLLLTALWTLPLLTWFLFCSAWSKRTPFIAAMSIPVVVVLLDQIFSLGLNIGGHIADRIPFGFRFGGSQQSFLVGLIGITTTHARDFSALEFGQFFRQPGLWAGLAVAAGWAALTVWVRRWRDDS